MNCFVAIDVPLLSASGCAEQSLVEICLTRVSAILDIIKNNKAQLLISNALMVMIYEHKVIPSLFLKALANTTVVKYDTESDANLVSTKPNILSQELGEVVVSEMKAMLLSLHCHKDKGDTVYVIGCERGFNKDTYLQISQEQSLSIHDMVHVEDDKNLSIYFNKYCPKLVQLKHHQFQYKLDGQDVSPFSAYDPQNTRIAEQLLKKALDDYEGEYSHDHPPQTLFTWDPGNKCYVCFHHSGRWEYHGHDLQPPYESVPEGIKEKYHVRY